MRTHVAVAIVISLTLSACGSSPAEQQARQAAEQMQKGVEGLARSADGKAADNVAKGAESMAKGFEDLAKGLAAMAGGDPNTKPVEPLSIDSLRSALADLPG